MAVATFSHRVEYPDNEGITLADIAEVLLAHHRVMQFLPVVLERSIDGIRIESLDIALVEAEEGSLILQFSVQIWTIYQENIQSRVIDVVEAMTGAEIPEELKPLITLLILLLIFMGAVWLYKRIRAGGDEGARIQGDYNSVLTITAQHLHVTPDRLEGILEEATKGPAKRSLSKAAQRFFRPAQRNGTGRIRLPHYGEISRETVSEVPTDVDIEAAQDERDMAPIPNVKIHLRAYDLDRREQGWYGRIESEGLDETRLPITLYPTINPETLKGRVEITADAIIEYRPDDQGELRPRRIHVVQIRS